jgi:DNA-binding transcriptional ArsR family regulator
MSRAVLLVDPDMDALGALASKLRSRGLIVTLADGPETAVERARGNRHEALLLSAALVESSDVLAILDAEKDLAALPRFVLVERSAAELGPSELPAGDADAVAKRIYGLASRAPAVPADRGDFRGDLKQVSVVDLLQLLSMNRRTGALSITTASGAGEVRLTEGEIVDAVYRRIEGEKALFRLLAENDGAFAFASGSPSPLRRVQTPTSALLMEGMRQIDEVRRMRDTVGGEQDALLAIAQPQADATDVARRIGELLTAPRTVDELLDDLPLGDLEILEALGKLIRDGSVRRIAKGAVRVALAEPEHLTVLAALVKRLTRNGFTGRARLLLAASPRRLATMLHAVGRIADALAPAELPPAAPVPHVLATLRLADGVELDMVALPNLDAYSPLWSLTVPGSVACIRLENPDSPVLDEVCAVAGVPLVDAGALIGDIDEADPAQMAALVRMALDTAAGH